jgi:DUF4097 and DUF4098 domain-containing protein YvlB
MKRILPVLLTGVLSSCLLLSGCGLKGGETASSVKEQSVEDTITVIKINWISGNIKFLQNEDNHIHIKQLASKEIPARKLFTYSVKDGVLTITDRNKTNLGFSTSTDLEISCPVQDFDSISVTCTNGAVDGNELQAKTLSVESTVGDIDVSGKFEAVNLNNHNGDVKVSCSQMPKSFSSNVTVGDITLNLPKNEGFSLVFDSATGNMDCDFALHKSGEKYIYKDGNVPLRIDITNGKLIIHQI